MNQVFLPVCVFLIFIMLALNAAAQLRVSDVDFSSPGKSGEVKPNELAEIIFEIENEGEDKIEDIEAVVYFERSGKKLDGNDGDDLEFDFDLDYIRGGKTKDVKFSFNVPFDVEDGEVYTIVIEVKGKNSSDREKYTDDDRSEEFEVVKEKHELLFYELDMTPTTISCDRTLNLHYDIRNIGERDEDINLSIVNKQLGINVAESFSLEREYDDDNKWEKSHSFEIPEAVPAGTYGLTINLYYDNGDGHQYNTTEVVVEECTGQADTTEQAGDATSTPTANDSQTQETAQPQDTKVVYTQPAAATSYPAAAPKKEEGMSNTMIIIIAAEIVIALLIVVLVLVLRKK